VAPRRDEDSLKEKALFSILLLCMIGSTFAMVLAFNRIDSVGERSPYTAPGGINSIMQIDRTLDSYSNALKEYQLNIGDTERARTWSAEFRKQFNIVWGTLNHFTVRLADGTEDALLFSNFKHDAEQFLEKTDPLMAADQLLSSDQISSINSELQILQNEIHELGTAYFKSSLSFRENRIDNLHKLYYLLYAFATALIGTAGLLVALLIRSNKRKNKLVQEADTARHELSKTVAELRSGKLEQRAKDSFIASASHDLSQPLHALGLFLGSLDEHVKDSKGRKTLREAIQCSNNLGYLFKSLLDMSRLDAGLVGVDKQHFRLAELVERLEQEFLQKAKNSAMNINIQVDDAVVYSDPILLSRIIRNLIDNAFVHSDANLIRVSCANSTKYQRLTIEDNGRGISKSEQQRIFGEYYQINNNTSAATKGLGLGLSIVHRLADLLETKILLESEPGVSTKFTLQIPLGIPDKVTVARDNSSKDSSAALKAGMVVAVVDDDENICTAMSLILQNMGLDSVTATSADTLIDKIIESDSLPDMIVADYRLLKGQTGDQAIMQLKRALNIDVPALLVTGDTSPHNIAHANSSGYDLLHKPVQPEDFSAKIKQKLLVSVQAEQLADSKDQTMHNPKQQTS